MTPTDPSLVDLLAVLCARHHEGALAEQLGGPLSASPRSAGHRHIEPTRFAGVRAVDVRPWTSDSFGEATLELTAPPAWTRVDIERALGPLQPVPPRPGGLPVEVEFSAVWDDWSLPARAVVYVSFEDRRDERPEAAVVSLTIRTESMERYR